MWERFSELNAASIYFDLFSINADSVLALNTKKKHFFLSFSCYTLISFDVFNSIFASPSINSSQDL